MLNNQIQSSQMTIQAAKSQNIVINMVWETDVPGFSGYAISFVFSMVNKQIQFSKIIIQTIVIIILCGLVANTIIL